MTTVPTPRLITATALLALLIAARADTALEQRDFVTPDDLKRVATVVIAQILAQVPVPL